MKYTPEHVMGKKAVVRDHFGKAIPYVISYDTETKEIETILMVDHEVDQYDDPTDIFSVKKVMQRMAISDGEALVVFKAIVKNSYLEIDGVRVA